MEAEPKTATEDSAKGVMVMVKDSQDTTPKSLSKIHRDLVDIYAVQCGKCFKWRVIPSQEEYEDIRSKFIEEPFWCEKRGSLSCEDPADIEYDASRTWVMDKHNIPKTPQGFKRIMVLRKDFSKMDAYYVTPSGKRLKSRSEVAAFLEANQQSEVVPLGNFSFSVPRVMEDTIPDYVERKAPVSSKKLKMAMDDA